MNEHPTQWLEAFLDGELAPEKSAQIADHLGSCEICAGEMAKIERLGSMLREAPRIQVDFPPLSLPGRTGIPGTSPISTKTDAGAARTHANPPRIGAGWLAAPLGVMAGWAFIQAALWISGGLLLLDETRQFFIAAPGSPSLWQQALSFLLLPGPFTWLQTLLGMLPGGTSWQLLSIQIISSAACAVLLIGFLAGWFSLRYSSQPVNG